MVLLLSIVFTGTLHVDLLETCVVTHPRAGVCSSGHISQFSPVFQMSSAYVIRPQFVSVVFPSTERDIGTDDSK